MTDEERTPPEKIRITGLQEAQLLDLQAIEARCAAMFYEVGLTDQQVTPRTDIEIARLTRNHDLMVAEADDRTAGYLAWADEAPGVAYLPILLMRFLQANHFTLILLVYSLYLLAEHLLSKVEHEPAARLLRGGAYALIAVIPALLVHHVFTSHESPVSTGALPSLMALDQPVSFRGETIYLGERMYVRGGSGTRASDVERVMGYVERYTEPGEPVVFMPNQSMYYYICDRPNPLAYIGLWAHRYVLDDQVAPAIIADYLDDLERVEPRYVFVGTTFHMGQAPALVDYLEQTYPNVKMVKDMDLVIFDNSETGGGARFLGARAVVDWKRYTPARIRRQGESADR